MINFPNWDVVDWMAFLVGCGFLIGTASMLNKVPGCCEVVERERTLRVQAHLCIEHPSAPGCKENNDD